jgi:hypothetical protein
VRKVVLVCALAAASAGCAMLSGKPKSDFKPPEPAAYYPLAIGNSWSYSANVLGDHSDQTITIVKRDFDYFVDDHKGRFKIDAYGLRDDKRYLLRVPLEVGRTWTSVISVQSVEHSRIIETDGVCAVLAGTFEHCLTVETTNRQDENHTLVMRMSFAPYVGIVKIQTAMETGGKAVPQSDVELTGYKVKPPEAAAPPAPAPAPPPGGGQ